MKRYVKFMALLCSVLLCTICLTACGEDTAHAHAFGKWETTKEATCLETGEEVRRCDCGQTESRIIPSPEHAFGEWEVDRQPSCTDLGRRCRTCTVCNTTETAVIPMTSHEFSGGKCRLCGAKENNVTTTTTKKPTTKKPTTTKRPAPQDNFTWYGEDTYKVGTDIPAGEYYIESTEEYMAYFAICEDSTGDNILDNENFYGPHFVVLEKGQYFELVRGRCTKASNIKMNVNAKNLPVGMYRVGKDIPAGEYKVTNNSDSMAYFAVYDDISGERHIRENDNFNKNQYITVYAGEYLYLVRCTGSLTAEATTQKTTATTKKPTTTKPSTSTTAKDTQLWTFDEAESVNGYASSAFQDAKAANDYMQKACSTNDKAFKQVYIASAQSKIRFTKSNISKALALFQANYGVDLTGEYATAAEHAEAIIAMCDAFINVTVSQSNCADIDMDMWDEALDIMNECLSMQGYSLQMMEAFL